MSRQYNPKKFLRQIPNQLLKEDFDRRSLLTEILWYLQRENRIEKSYNAWQSLPDTQRANVDKDFQDVDEMACEAGVKAMIEEGHFHGIDLATQLGGLDGFHHKAMWVFLHHSHIF